MKQTGTPRDCITTKENVHYPVQANIVGTSVPCDKTGAAAKMRKSGEKDNSVRNKRFIAEWELIRSATGDMIRIY